MGHTSQQTLTLGDLAERGLLRIDIGVRLDSKQSSGGQSGLPIVMPDNIRPHRIATATIARLAPDAVVDSRYTLRAGDIIFSRRGDLTRRALIGAREEGWICGNGCMRLRVEPRVIDPQFAYFQLAQPTVSEWLLARAVGSTLPHINKGILASLPFHMPALPRQHELAAMFALLERKLTLLVEMNETLLESADAHLSLLLKDASPERAAFESDCGALPEGFRIVPLSECCQRIENGRTPASHDDDAWSGPVPWLTSSEVRQGVIVRADKALSRNALLAAHLKSWPKGSTIIAMFGNTAGMTGWLAMEAAANQACCGLVPYPHLSAYLYRYMAGAGGILRRLVNGTAQRNLNQGAIARLPILLPPLEALKAYEISARPMLEKIAHNAIESGTLSNLRDSLYPMLSPL